MTSNYVVERFFQASTKPLECTTLLDEHALLGNIGLRLLYVAQAIVSLVSLPLIFLIGVFEAALRLCTCNGTDAKGVIKATVQYIIGSSAISLASLIATFRPKSFEEATESRLKSFEEATESRLSRLERVTNWMQTGTESKDYGLDLQGDDHYRRNGASTSSDEELLYN